MKVATVLLIMSLLGVSTLAAQNRVVIDKTKLRNLARDAGVLSMIETKESVVEPHDGADFDRAPSLAASTPRDSQPAEEQSRSAPVADAASEGEAVPNIAACEACAWKSCTLHMPIIRRRAEPAEEKSRRRKIKTTFCHSKHSWHKVSLHPEADG